MHFRTHVSDERMADAKEILPTADEYTAGMLEHDMHVGEFLGTFKDYPPRQKAASFALDKVMETLTNAGAH